MSARGRTRLFLDIETLPGDESVREEIARTTHPPAGHSTPEALERWEEEQKPAQVEHAYRRTSLRGHAGRILCVGYIKEAPGRCDEGVLTGRSRPSSGTSGTWCGTWTSSSASTSWTSTSSSSCSGRL